MKDFSIVIPIYNEDKYIEGLLESIFQVNYPRAKYEVIVVNDASTDETPNIVKKFPEVYLVDLKTNVGRYAARKVGAEVSEYPHILFVDSRAVVDPNILSVLNRLDEKIVVGTVLSPENPGVFDTFYVAIRRIVFQKHFTLAKNPIRLTRENFDSLAKGTTVLYVEKETLFKAYERLSTVNIGKNSSDDIRLIHAIVQSTEALIHPDVKIIGLSRTSFWTSFMHLMWRGRTFTDYYFHPSKRNFWLVIVLPLLVLLAISLGIALIPIPLVIKIAALFGLDLIITLVLARTFRELVIILFMLPVCVFSFYAGIIQGIYLKFYKAFGLENGKSKKDFTQIH
jgi:glycosyltransferase involved in cell wall biosynthesis